MIITLFPLRVDDAPALSLARQGDALVIDGAPLDLSQIYEGDILWGSAVASDAVCGDPIRRVDGVLHLAIRLPYSGSDEDAPESVRFPAPITVTKDGPIMLPTGPVETPPPAPPIGVDWSMLEKAGEETVIVPTVISMRQAKLQLSRAGLLAPATAAIEAMEGQDGEEARIEWEYATELRRDHPLIAGIGQALGLDEAAIDGLFIEAAKIG